MDEMLKKLIRPMTQEELEAALKRIDENAAYTKQYIKNVKQGKQTTRNDN